MVSEVDQKYLGVFAKQTASNNPELSAALYKVLGLSTLLNRKLHRAVGLSTPLPLLIRIPSLLEAEFSYAIGGTDKRA